MTTHLDRKELKRPDAFLEQINALFKTLASNTKLLVGILVGVIVIGLGLAVYSSQRAKKAELAGSALYSARKNLGATLEKAGTGDGWETKAQAELQALEKFTQDYKGTAAASEGLLLLGDIYLARQNTAKATEYLKKAADQSSSKTFKAMALHGLAYIYENAKQTDQAIATLQQVLSIGEASVRPDASLALARNYETKGDKAKATAIYDQIVKDFPNSGVSKIAEAQKSQLK